MTVAIMQPYIFPYLGYYQLVGAVDTFVFFDDVNFINKGWINRNRILQQNEPEKFTVPLIKASQNKLINQHEISDYPKWRDSFVKLIEFRYKKAPNFLFTFGWLKDFLFANNYSHINNLAADSVIELSRIFGINPRVLFSSSLEYKIGVDQRGQDKILSICNLLHADRYINPQNGVDLYDDSVFQQRSIDLQFIHMGVIRYKQFDENSFVESLSILDVLMFNSIDIIKEFLKNYKLFSKNSLI